MKFSIVCVTAVLMEDPVFGKELVHSLASPKERQDVSNIGDLREKKNRPYSSSLTEGTPVYKRPLRAHKFRDFVHHKPNKVTNRNEDERVPPVEIKNEDSLPGATVEKIKSHDEIKDAAADLGNLLPVEDGNLLQRKKLIKRDHQDRSEIPHDNSHGNGFTNQRVHVPTDKLQEEQLQLHPIYSTPLQVTYGQDKGSAFDYGEGLRSGDSATTIKIVDDPIAPVASTSSYKTELVDGQGMEDTYNFVSGITNNGMPYATFAATDSTNHDLYITKYDEAIQTRHLEQTGEDCASTCSSRPVVTKNGEDFQKLVYYCFNEYDNSDCPSQNVSCIDARVSCPYPDVKIGCWDTSDVTDMNGAFENTGSFNQPINCWNTASVTNMDTMFSYAFRFNQPINDWNVARVSAMLRTFSSAIKFNQPLNDWNVGSVSNMGSMFYGASTFNQRLDDWNVAGVTSTEIMFSEAIKFNQPITDWNVASVTSMERMFDFAFEFNQQLNDWNVARVDAMRYMFFNAIEFNQCLSSWAAKTPLDVSLGYMLDDTSCPNKNLDARVGPWCQGEEEGCIVPSESPSLSLYQSNKPSVGLSVEPSAFPSTSAVLTSIPSGTPSAGPTATIVASSLGPSSKPSVVPSEAAGPTATISVSPSKGSCENTKFNMIPDDAKGKMKRCPGLLNQLFSPPTDVEKLRTACNKRIKSTDPNNDMVLVSEACPTFCSFDTCCPVDKHFEFRVDGKKKKCGWLLNALVADKTSEGKAALAEECAAERIAVTGGTAVVKDICTGLCRVGCEIVKCVNKKPDQFLLIPDDNNIDNKFGCNKLLKNLSKEEKKIVCKEKISIYNVAKGKIRKKKQTPKLICPLYCDNRCKKQLALQ